jgi:DNA-directed RNA polymerase II subunit RPB2
MEESAVWSIIDSYFKNNPNCLVSHHLDSYNDFFKNGIFQIFRERGPIELSSNFDESTGEFKNKCILHLGGKDGKRIYFGKPVIYDDKNSHYMFPNEARLRNMTYGMTIHYDIEVEYISTLSPGEKPTIVGEEIIEKHGGLSYKEYEEKESDYTHEIERPFRNVKDIADDDVAELHDGQDGGARKKQEGTQKKEDKRKKVTRTKRTIKPFQMTPGIAAALREATEKSMISPNTQSRTQMLSNIYLGKFPIMLQSEFCVLHGLTPEIRHTMGECRSDVGGYFIIQGLEKTVIAQEKFADNMLWVRKGKDTVDDDGEVISATEYLYSADIRSVSENVSKPIRNLSVQILADSETSQKNIVVNVPNVRKPVPLFILFRALGILSDKDIIQMCLLDMNKYEHMLDLFAPSVHDAGAIMTQSAALKYIASLTKGKRKENAMEILSDYFLPHIGEVNFSEKAYYLGHMVFKLLSVYTGLEPPTDRDNFKYKRLELVGSLMYDLFREYYNLQWKNIQVELEKRLYYNNNLYANNLPNLIQTFYEEIFKNRIVETGFKKAFKGNWGSQTNTKRIGVVQDINRLSFNSFMSHLRKTNLPMDAGSKLVEPRKLHCSQWGFIDPIDTPDGGNIGLHKSLAIATHVTRGGSGLRGPIVQWLREKISLKYVDECSPQVLAEMTKIMVNGYWAGSIMDPFDCINKIKLFRRNALLPIYMSVTFEIKTNTIYIYTDAGRLSRPIFYKDDMTQKMSFEHSTIEQKIKDRDFDWMDLICGFNRKREEAVFHPDNQRIYELFELYEGLNNETNPTKLERFLNKKAIIDYIDCSESENALIAVNPEDYEQHKTKNFTHLEIHESLIFGNMCNLIAFPENNPPTRNSFSCGQSKQAVSLYHTNYLMRMDKTAVVLNSGQTPLIKTRYLNYINHEENPYGENVIVAIMCYTGYNVEDAVLINEGSLKRGLFRTTYYTSYQSHEESSKSGDVVTDIKFANIESESDVVGTKPGYDYSKLDKYGLIREGTEVDDKTVLIGLTSSVSGVNKKIDGSKTPKKGQLGIVDKTFITEGEEGERIAKVRIREERVPNLGDKLACALPTQQVLTQLGWVEIKDIDITVHKVATLDKNKNMCYEHPIRKFEYDHDGQMYYVKNKQVHVICTLNHRLYVKKRDRKEYEFIQAQDVVGKMVCFQKSMPNTQLDVETINIGDKQFKMDDWLQFLGMFISDGSVNNRGVVLSAHKQRKTNFIIDIFTKLGLEYKHDNYQGYFALNLGKHREIYEEMKKYSLGALNKYLPDYVWNLSQRQCIILMEALMEGDGHTYADGFSRYGTISVRLANDVSRLAVHCGWSGVIKNAEEPDGVEKTITGTMGYGAGKTSTCVQRHTYYKISIIRKQNEPYINKKVNDSNEEKLIDYNGKVYCIEMPSSNLYYMRENFLAPSMLIGNSRVGQKGTVGMIIPESNMPFTRDGIRPDMIINPHAIPSRMTIGQLVECIVGKVCLMAGGFGDCTAFINKGSKVRLFGEFLTKIGHNPSKTDTENLLKNGYHSSGNEIFYNGMTGEQIEGEIFVGPTYYMRLKHMVKDKINYRALGPRTALTKQPVSGRANDGGLRIGEMERDSVASHGIVDFLTESMMERGDKYYMAVCNMTGLLAIYNPSKNLFMSPMADGPLKFVGSLDGKEMHIENITRFGRSFSVISVPYSFKLLIQELQTINIQMRIITEDNIQQLENMTFSKNIEKLMQLEEEPTHLKKLEMVKQATTRAIKEGKTGEQMDEWNAKYGNILTPSVPSETSEASETIGSPEYMETTPEYQSLGSNAASPYHPPTQSPNETEGGAPNYELDELVHLRGDPEAPRLWKVVDIGPNTVTINLHNTAGNDSELMPMDRNEIKVVQKHDLIKLDQMVYAGRPESNMVPPPPDMKLPVILPGQMMSQGQPMGGDVPANIHFAPVINVVGRDNTGVIDFPDTENQGQGIPPQTMMTIGGTNNDPTLPSVLSPPPPPSLDNTATEQTNHTFTDGKLNFDNLVIKKI